MKTSTMLTVIVLTLLSSFFTLTLAAPVTDTALNLLPNGTTLNAYKNAATELKQYAATQLSPNYAIKMTGSTDYAVSIAPTNSGGKSKQAVILLCGGFFWEGCDHTVVTDGKCAMITPGDVNSIYFLEDVKECILYDYADCSGEGDVIDKPEDSLGGYGLVNAYKCSLK